MSALAIALFLSFAPPGGEAAAPGDEASSGAEASPEPEAGTPVGSEPTAKTAQPELLAPTAITLRPRQPGRYLIRDSHGALVLDLVLGPAPEAGRSVQLPPGIYSAQSSTGSIVSIPVAGEAELIWDGEAVRTAAADKALREAETEAIANADAERAQARLEARVQAQTPKPSKRASRALWAAPLASAIVPGAGQFINGQGGKGTGILFATVASISGAAILYNSPTDGTRPLGREYARLIGYGALSSAAAVLWLYAVADAHEVAADKEVTPVLDHKLRLGVNRTMSVGFRADVNRPGFYDEWGLSLMGQATDRLTVGVSDLSVKFGTAGDPRVWQVGLRGDYRVFDRRRLWIDLGLGVALQFVGSTPPIPLDPELADASPALAVGAIPYGVLDLRYFVLDHLSLDFSPRIAVPATTRHYSANRATPRLAPMLEMGVGSSVYF